MDRLSALMSRFDLTVLVTTADGANFQVLADANSHDPSRIRMKTSGAGLPQTKAPILLSAVVDWGGSENPMMRALPDLTELNIEQDAETKALAHVLTQESRALRCGSGSVLNRICEVLIVRLLRHHIEIGSVQAGLLAGLSDHRLSRAIVAMHDRPQDNWRVASLASEAGLSASRFAELFRATVGVSPLAYLRSWRLILARQDLSRGERVQRVADRYCYRSSEALSRAIVQAYGVGPMQIRKAAG